MTVWFVEWLMCLPLGHVCDVPGLTRGQQLQILGNGVVLQQASAAFAALLKVGSAGTELGFIRPAREVAGGLAEDPTSRPT
ncbi:hypothetical protein [Streptomyces sp. ADI97-07]|uniref:hypothetical protein n=1 Tax=Streptomyces sp. ADI97-07 TaxID=1522762 RepID=UPI0013DDF301|nr:hypothetical protein [Streptomyces sp. ADI97-07]